jgi:hypothetical protein
MFFLFSEEEIGAEGSQGSSTVAKFAALGFKSRNSGPKFFKISIFYPIALCTF